MAESYRKLTDKRLENHGSLKVSRRTMQFVREFRTKRGWTQLFFAEMTGTDAKTVSNWENGRTGLKRDFSEIRDSLAKSGASQADVDDFEREFRAANNPIARPPDVPVKVGETPAPIPALPEKEEPASLLHWFDHRHPDPAVELEQLVQGAREQQNRWKAILATGLPSLEFLEPVRRYAGEFPVEVARAAQDKLAELHLACVRARLSTGDALGEMERFLPLFAREMDSTIGRWPSWPYQDKVRREHRHIGEAQQSLLRLLRKAWETAHQRVRAIEGEIDGLDRVASGHTPRVVSTSTLAHAWAGEDRLRDQLRETMEAFGGTGDPWELVELDEGQRLELALLPQEAQRTLARALAREPWEEDDAL